MSHHQIIAEELAIGIQQVSACAALLADGATVPFIARYRKEATGELDEVQIAVIRDRLTQLAELDKRRGNMLDSLRERALLTAELEQDLIKAANMQVLEDLYLPFRIKRRTRAQQARERGLQALAEAILHGAAIEPQRFINSEQDLPDAEACLAGARDIIAEMISEDAPLRQELRALFATQAVIRSQVVKKHAESDAAARFRDWFDFAENLGRAPGHRILALLRGAEQGFLRISARPEDALAQQRIENRYLRGHDLQREQLRLTCEDAYHRLLLPALENEALKLAKQRADREAIAIFQSNLQELLLAAPFGRKRVLAIDPGLRTGCKIAALDEHGALLAHAVIHLAQGRAAEEQAGATLTRLVEHHAIAAIAIGDGTASRETESFVQKLHLPCQVTTVSEAGASVYSASDLAREEFPDLDLTVRGAISIGRRLQDPLAELVKVDAKSIGVGQYQHDVDQTALKRGLDDVVESAVNRVGVELNSASAALLTYVAGLGPKLAQAIITYRNEYGAFTARTQLKKVPRLGAKAFEQCAGFLRIGNARNPLDASAVHPERYELVKRMAADQGSDVSRLIADRELRRGIDLQRYIGGDVGEPTLRDILAELDKPGRDPRPAFTTFQFADVHSLDDLQPGMVLPGIVSNVAAFGAFVDIGVHQDGLVHISQLANRFVKDPSDIVKVRQQVTVRVLEIDQRRKRIALSMKE